MKCEWCGREHEKGIEICLGCGQRLVEHKTKEKKCPYFYHGFMIWEERDFSRRVTEFHVWLGERHIGSFQITDIMFESYHAEKGDYCDCDELIMGALRLVLGESEVEKWKDINQPRRFDFEMRRVESDEYLQAKTLIKELLCH
jgi:hypothetical protein